MYFWGRSSDRGGDRVWHAAIPVLMICASLITAAMLPADGFSILVLAIGAIAAPCWLGPFYSLLPLFLTGRGLAGGIAAAICMGNLTGGFGGQYLIGVLRQQSGGYAASFAVMAAGGLLAAIIVLSLGRSLQPRGVAQTVLAQ
jgi:MFS transporter, ACS family, tartrate transporter